MGNLLLIVMKFTAILFLSFLAICHGLRCQTCSGGDYKCEGENDNGQSVECPVWSTSCVYAKYYRAYEGEDLIIRACSSIDVGCSSLETGIECFCSSDNCNVGETCSCLNRIHNKTYHVLLP